MAGSSSSLGLTYRKPLVDAEDSIADALALTVTSSSSLSGDDVERSMTGMLDQFAVEESELLAII